MKDLRLTVRIRKSPEEVFDFTTDPANTPRWIASIEREEASPLPVALDTIFRNWSDKGHMNEYRVTKFERPNAFQLDSTKEDYKVRYTYTPLALGETELEYYEWSESGQLHAPFMQEILDALKVVMERGI